MSEELNTVPAAGLEAVRNIETITTEILFYSQQAGTAIIEIGNRLLEAKSQLDHGEWLPWLTERVKFSERTAQRLMKLAEGYSKSDTVTDLGTGKALALLALNPVEREEFIAEKHAVRGTEKTVSEMSKKELETAIRERKAAQEAERAAINRADAMESQLTKEREKLKQEEERKKALTEELENLKAQPIPEPMGLSVTELHKIRREETDKARERVKQEVEERKAETERIKTALREEIRCKDEEIENAYKKNLRIQGDLKKERERVEKVSKVATVNGDAELATAKVHFQNAQTAINNLQECINSLRKSGNEKQAAGLSRALTAICDAAKAAVSA